MYNYKPGLFYRILKYIFLKKAKIKYCDLLVLIILPSLLTAIILFHFICKHVCLYAQVHKYIPNIYVFA